MTAAPPSAYDDVVLGRRSIRGFTREPVPKALIEEVIGLALRAPSSFNTQPWRLTVVTGAPLERIREENTRLNVEGVPSTREVRYHGDYVGPHRERQIGVAKQLFGAMGIERHDQAARQDWVLRGFRQFDAPVAVVVSYDRTILGGDIGPFDCGALTNALVNAAWSRGLGCVINSQGIMHSAVVREHGCIPDDQVIMICVAVGWPDETFPANGVVSHRRSVEEAARFVGFDGG